MNEEIYTRDKSAKRRVEPENQTQSRSHAGKLKNETSRAEAMRKKLRTGKADTAETKLEIKKTAKIHKQGRKAARKNAVVTGEIRHSRFVVLPKTIKFRTKDGELIELVS